MQILSGAKIQNSNLGEAVKVADLIYFEGPLLSLFRSRLSENLLFYWCDNSGTHNRWLVVKVSDATLDRYLTRDMPLSHIIQNPKDQFLYAVDVSNQGVYDSVIIVSPLSLPAEYIPDETSYYLDTPIRVNDGPREERIAIDGDWDFEDLSKFPSLYSSIYSLIYLAQPSAGNATEGRPFEAFPLRDGFSSVHFFNSLKDAVPADDKSEFRAMSYASPGAIVFKLDPEVASIVRGVYNRFKASPEDFWTEYKTIHKTLKEANYLGADVMTIALDPAMDDYLKRLGRQFSEELGGLDYDTILAKSVNSLMAIKIILGFFRRLARLFD